MRLSRVLKAVEAAEVETETSIQVAAPAKLATTWSRSAEEIFEAGELEALQRAEPGEAKVYPRLRKKDAKAISEAAEELGLCVTREGKSKDLVVYKSGEELLFGTVPYSFDELGLHPVVLSALQRWTPEPLRQATHIQASAIPKILEGQDVSIQSETGSGKTLAYLLPAAHFAAQATYGEDDEEWEDMDDEMLAEQEEEESRAKDHEFEARMPEEPQKSVCYKVKQTATRKGTRLVSRPEEFATPTGKKIYQGDEFMSKSVSGSPLGLHFIELADGRGWFPWDRKDLLQRFSLTARQYSKGQRVEAKETIEYGSGDIVKRGQRGVVERLLPFLGVKWEGLPGVKAIPKPWELIQDERKVFSTKEKWANCAPDTLILTANRELCEQVAGVARQLGSLLPEDVQENWKVAVAVGAPPGAGKKGKRTKEDWPFPRGEDAPNILVSTLEFMGYFFHKKHVSLWANIKYVVYDEVDNLVSGTKAKLLERIKVMFLRARRMEGGSVQSVLVSCVMPSQGGKSTRMLIGKWMPHALRALERPDLLHRSHPMIPMKWNYVPEGFDEKVRLLLAHLKNEIGYATAENKGFKFMREKTIIFCNSTDTASRLGELLATTYGFRKLGLFVKKIGYDERRNRLKMFREGRITLMVSTDLLSRGIDIPDLKNVIQFDFSRNVVNHLLRSGRASRAGARGRVFCMYDDDEQGGKALAEAIQELDTQPLDGLFSRRRGFRHMLQRTEAFRQMLLIQGLPLPPHLQAGPEEPLARIGNSEALREDALQRALWDEDTESTPSEPEEEEAARSTTNRQFDRARESQKDFEFNEALEAMEEEEEEMLLDGEDEAEDLIG